jgi:hypothetical protein
MRQNSTSAKAIRIPAEMIVVIVFLPKGLLLPRFDMTGAFSTKNDMPKPFSE